MAKKAPINADTSAKTPDKMSPASTSQSAHRTSSPQEVPQDTTSTKVINFVWIGVVVTIIDYLAYLLFLFLLFGGNTDHVPICTAASAIVATIFAYFLHSHITWRARDPGRYGVMKFFLWNLVLAVAVRPFLSWIMGFMTVVYDLAFGISEWLHLPFTHDFVTSTGVYGFMTVVTMVLNYFIYDALVFGQPRFKRKEKKA